MTAILKGAEVRKTRVLEITIKEKSSQEKAFVELLTMFVNSYRKYYPLTEIYIQEKME
jgi:hypothetical protein